MPFPPDVQAELLRLAHEIEELVDSDDPAADALLDKALSRTEELLNTQARGGFIRLVQKTGTGTR